MNKDRGIIKWLPFESLVSSKQVIDSILHEKNKIKKPILSLEQQQEISEKLIKAFYEQDEVTLKIYKNGYIITLISFIKNIDYTYKKIVLNNDTKILFSQIVDIILS